MGMRWGLLFLFFALEAKANVNLLKYELQMKRRGELLSERSKVRTKTLIGIDPESCRHVTGPQALTALLKKQIEIIRSIGELNHCEHIAAKALTAIDNELINYTLPPAVPLLDSRPPITKSGTALPVEFQYDYAPTNVFPAGRRFIDPLFKSSSATHFAGFRLSEEGMHALRVFYGAEKSLNIRTFENANYPLVDNEVFIRYPECRVIISGGIEFTSAMTSNVRDYGNNSECARACSQKLESLIAEKKPTGYLMTCHHLGEIVMIESKGNPLEQGIKSVEADGGGKYLLGRCVIKVQGGDVLQSTPVAYRSECLGRFKDAYLEYEKKLPFTLDDPPAPVIESYLNDQPLIRATISRARFAAPGTYSGQCAAEVLVLLKNQDRVIDVAKTATPAGGCLAWCAEDFKVTNKTAPTAQMPRGTQGSAVQRWHYRCTDGSGNKLMQCSYGQKQGCML
jgi:hypothetical protein